MMYGGKHNSLSGTGWIILAILTLLGLITAVILIVKSIIWIITKL